MNKYKKIATAVVATVMAGTMVLSLAACKDNNNTQSADKPTLDENGKLSYASGTKLTLNIGYNSADTGISYSSKNIETLNGHTLMGTTQSELTLKPAWSALQSKLGVSFTDVYNGKAASANLGDIKDGTGGLASVTAFTASASTINAEGVASGTLLDINQYLQYMPNYKAFLEANPVVWASLIAEARTGAMYMIPYFDGNDDIEKYVLMRKDIVETLLNTGALTSTTTFAGQADAKNGATVKPATAIVGTSASVESFMGKTGSWTIETTDPAALNTDSTAAWGSDATSVKSGSEAATVKVRVDYDKALAAAKDTTTDLGAAINAAAGKAYDGTSGNIVDLQNFAINEKSGNVTGSQLLSILRAYIDVAYLNEAGTASFYSEANGLTRAGVFNSACAAWDADLYTALGRCFVTNGSILGDKAKETSLLYLIAGRAYTTQRTTDVASLAGELYGVRGLESRYNYTYIKNDGTIGDARSEESTWDALDKMHDLALEGLFNTTSNVTADWLSVNASSNKGIQTLSLHDYVQTQTAKYGFSALDASEYNFAPILTPVSVWNDGTGAKKMRFTESWRGVKDGGIAISKSNVLSDPDVLAATLAFIDYCYSSDGQLLMTYGPQSTNGNTNPNGTWYANEATNVNIADVADVSVAATNYSVAQYTVKDAYLGQYFVYEGKVYSGTFYNGRQIPILTDENLDVFNKNSGHNFTNHARQLLGTTLPVWNKDQGFEYLCTADCGLAGADIVNIALNNGTVKHPVQTISSSSYWYTLVPTQLPYTSTVTSTLGAASGLAVISGLGADTDNFFVSTSKTDRNLLLDIMYYGYDTSKDIAYVTSYSKKLPANAAGVVTMMNDVGLTTLMTYKSESWQDLLTWYSNVTK